MKTRRFPIVVLLALASSPFACQSNTNDNFVNPPPGPPSTCTLSTSVPDCEGSSVGYVCPAGAAGRPDHRDTNLVCNGGTPAAIGMAYCCAPYGQYFSDCTTDTSVPDCPATWFGFRCSGPEDPGDADLELACSPGTASGTDTLYCCNTEVLSAPSCAPDPVTPLNPGGIRCPGSLVGYACVVSPPPAVSITPEALDPNLACSKIAAGEFCCTGAEGSTASTSGTSSSGETSGAGGGSGSGAAGAPVDAGDGE